MNSLLNQILNSDRVAEIRERVAAKLDTVAAAVLPPPEWWEKHGEGSAESPCAEMPPPAVLWWQMSGGFATQGVSGRWLLIAGAGDGPMPPEVVRHLLNGGIADLDPAGGYTLRPQIEGVSPPLEMCDS